MADRQLRDEALLVLSYELRAVQVPLAAFIDKLVAELELRQFSWLRRGTRAVVNSFRQAVSPGG